MIRDKQPLVTLSKSFVCVLAARFERSTFLVRAKQHNHSAIVAKAKNIILSIKNIKLKVIKSRLCLKKYIFNFSAPFDMAIVVFILMIIFLWKFWPENYGNKQTEATTSFILASHILQAGTFIPYFIKLPLFYVSDPRIVLLGLSSAFFEASLHIFIIEWTPVLLIAANSTDHKSLPLGFIFAGFLVRIDI